MTSGDPSPDGVVLWTRLAPDPTRADGGVRPEGTAAVRARSVHVELDRLEPSTEYFYGGQPSRPDAHRAAGRRERRRTAVRVRLLSELPGDLVFYIYEGASGRIRPHAPAAEIKTLADYGMRHPQHHGDLHLQASHAALDARRRPAGLAATRAGTCSPTTSRSRPMTATRHSRRVTSAAVTTGTGTSPTANGSSTRSSRPARRTRSSSPRPARQLGAHRLRRLPGRHGVHRPRARRDRLDSRELCRRGRCPGRATGLTDHGR